MFRKIFEFTVEFPRNAIIEFKIEHRSLTSMGLLRLRIVRAGCKLGRHGSIRKGAECPSPKKVNLSNSSRII